MARLLEVRAGGVPGAALAAGAVLLLSLADGGFFREAWRPATVGLLSAAGLALVLRPRTRITAPAVIVVGGLAALVAFSALSALWSPDPEVSLLEAERTLVYAAATLAAAAVGGRLLAGTLTGVGVVCAYAVGRWVADPPPGPPGSLRALLEEPLGYANALGGLAAIGVAVAVTLAVTEPRLRLLCGALACLFVLTLFLTANRGGWVAAVAGIAVALALAALRLRLARALLAAAGAALAAVLALPATPLVDELAARLGDRPWYWHVAWQEVARAPVLGRGLGSFQLAWLEHQPIPVGVLDAHSLYLETLAELGLVGLALLSVALAPPLLAALRGAAPAAAGGYVAFLAHAGLEWDWEMPAVTVAGLCCGIVLLTQRTPQAGGERAILRQEQSRKGVL